MAIQITRTGFEEALSQACLSHYDPDVYADYTTWQERRNISPVRVQWDPERDVTLQPLPWRSLQVGLSGNAARNYVKRWTVRIEDITSRVHDIHQLATTGRVDVARSQLPTERTYPLPHNVARIINADQSPGL